MGFLCLLFQGQVAVLDQVCHHILDPSKLLVNIPITLAGKLADHGLQNLLILHNTINKQLNLSLPLLNINLPPLPVIAATLRNPLEQLSVRYVRPWLDGVVGVRVYYLGFVYDLELGDFYKGFEHLLWAGLWVWVIIINMAWMGISEFGRTWVDDKCGK